MNPEPFLHPLTSNAQLELSRQAARDYAHRSALDEARRQRTRPPRPVRRLRHGLAEGLVAAARMIDAT
jgi:hypothetical protein